MALFKNSDANNCDSYRPISVSTVSKCVERAEHVTAIQSLSFNRSSLYQAIRFSSEEINLECATREHGQWIINVCDIPKPKRAFDTVNHHVLLLKLRELGADGRAAAWIKS